MALPEKPLTRRETYLAKAAGQEVTLPEEDITREETYLRAIAEGGGGGGVTPEYVAEAIAEAKTDIEAEIPTKTSDLTNDSGYAAIDDTVSAQNKAYSSAKVEEKVAGEEITTTATGSDLTLSTSSGNLNALTVYGKSEVVDGSIKSAGEDGSIEVQTYTGTNRFGGIDFAQKLHNTAHTSVIDTVNKTVTFNRSLSGSIEILYNNFKANTQYTLILSYINDSRNTSLRIRYTDDTYSEIRLEPVSQKTIYRIVTDTNKSVQSFALGYYSAGLTTLYYDECGIFEGVKTASEFEPYNGTMAVFTTGTPLKGIPDSEVRDVMEWDGSSGEVTKKCAKVRLANLDWNMQQQSGFTAVLSSSPLGLIPLICSTYSYSNISFQWRDFNNYPNKTIFRNAFVKNIYIKDTDYTTVSDFVASLGDAELVYELETPTIEQLTTTENASFAGLETYNPQTHAQNNAGATMTVEAYAGTGNGKAVNELKQDVQSEISALKITQSNTLTLTTAGWSSNQQTVTYAHDTSKRNVIDVDFASVEEWAGCGILATAETATSITFTCKTVPTNALNFRVTSMGVN